MGIGLDCQINAMRLAKVTCARKRILERLVAFIGARCPLQCDALLGCAFCCKAIRMDFALYAAKRPVERLLIKGKGLGQPE